MKQFARNTRSMLNRAQQLGLVSSSGKPLVIDQIEELEAARLGFRNRHACRKALARQGEPALKLNTDDTSGAAYTMTPEAKECWITMGGFNVHLYFTDEGMVSDVFASGAEADSIASTYAFNSDVEDALAEEFGLDLDDVAEWVGLHYGRNFDTEPVAARRDWIQRYHEAATEAQLVEENSQLAALEEVGYCIRFQFSSPSSTGGWVWEAPSAESETAFHTEDLAIENAWEDAVSQVKAIHELSDESWAALSWEEQRRLVLTLGQDS